MSRKLLHRLAIPLIALTIAHPLFAQAPASASIPASAQVINPVTLTTTHALDFGRMLPSSTKTITPNSAAGARVELSGASGSAISISISVPNTLRTTTGDAISIAGWNYMLAPTADLSGATAVTFSGIAPVSASATLGGSSGTSKLYLALGAMVQTVAASPAGAYSATGQVTAAYTDL